MTDNHAPNEAVEGAQRPPPPPQPQFPAGFVPDGTQPMGDFATSITTVMLAQAQAVQEQILQNALAQLVEKRIKPQNIINYHAAGYSQINQEQIRKWSGLPTQPAPNPYPGPTHFTNYEERTVTREQPPPPPPEPKPEPEPPVPTPVPVEPSPQKPWRWWHWLLAILLLPLLVLLGWWLGSLGDPNTGVDVQVNEPEGPGDHRPVPMPRPVEPERPQPPPSTPPEPEPDPEPAPTPERPTRPPAEAEPLPPGVGITIE